MGSQAALRNRLSAARGMIGISDLHARTVSGKVRNDVRRRGPSPIAKKVGAVTEVMWPQASAMGECGHGSHKTNLPILKQENCMSLKAGHDNRVRYAFLHRF